MPPLKITFAPGWWWLIGERCIDDGTDPEVLHYEPTDEDDDFSDLDQEAVRDAVTRIVNKRLQIVADFLNTYDYEGMSTPSPQGSPSKQRLKPDELVVKCGISSKVHKVVNWRDKWNLGETRFDQLVERFAEEIISGRLRHLLAKGYLPEEYSDCWEKMAWIVPKDPEFFLMTDYDFRKIHEARMARSERKKTRVPEEDRAASSASSSSASGTSSSDPAPPSSSASGRGSSDSASDSAV